MAKNVEYRESVKSLLQGAENGERYRTIASSSWCWRIEVAYIANLEVSHQKFDAMLWLIFSTSDSNVEASHFVMLVAHLAVSAAFRVGDRVSVMSSSIYLILPVMLFAF